MFDGRVWRLIWYWPFVNRKLWAWTLAGVTGIVLTKLDGTAKGGIAVAIAKELNLPIRYAGIGEQLADLVVFNPEEYVNGLFA